MSLNKIVIMGRMTADPEMRRTQSGTEICSFTLAVDQDYRHGDEKKTDFIDCVAFGKTAIFVSKYFQKGDMSAITGRLQIRVFSTKDGEKRRNAEVIVESIYFCGSKNKMSLGNNSDFIEMQDDSELPF